MNILRYILLAVCIEFIFLISAMPQDNPDEDARHLYRPQSTLETIVFEEMQDSDTIAIQVNTDSLNARLRFVEDSINARMQFIQDSLLIREEFVRDSIAKRKRIIDSLNVFIAQLPRLLDASQKAFSNEIIFKTSKIRIIGDSTLSNFESTMLTFDFSSAFTPWKSVLNLSNKPPVFLYEQGSKRIISIQAPKLNCNFTYGSNDQVLVVRTKSSVLSKRTGKLYKEPIDSVFFDWKGRVMKVKKYIQFYEVVNNYHRGRKLFLHLAYIKQFEYNVSGEMTKYEITKFCDRWQAWTISEVCNVISYTIIPGENIYKIVRQNTPDNKFSDGTFTYEFKAGNILSSVSFENNKKTERWKTIIEVNEAGNVSRYLYQNKGLIHKTLLVNYYLNKPGAKHKVETVSCIFEDDGISYYQKNNTTGKARSRDEMTLEWSDWR